MRAFEVLGWFSHTGPASPSPPRLPLHRWRIRVLALPVERRDAVLSACDRLAVDDAEVGAKASQCLDNEREAFGQVVARAEPCLFAVLAAMTWNP
jgi:hypothetical protein